MKKSSSKSVKSVKEVIEPVIADLEQKQQATAAATEQPKAKTIKMVAIFIANHFFTAVTEKAQLLTLPAADNTETKVWLAKSLISLIDDADHPERTLCRMPAWLYFRKELNKFFPNAEWSTETIPAKPEEPEHITYDGSVTPLIKQFNEMKRKHPDAILLFRVGDFYECFSDDAVETSEILGITLTKRANGAKGGTISLSGFPHHALDTYLPKLVRAGKRVAICEQLAN